MRSPPPDPASPLGRFGTPAKSGRSVRFILECDFFTGRTIEVDGGAVEALVAEDPLAPAR